MSDASGIYSTATTQQKEPEIRPEVLSNDPIKQPLGASVALTGGRDYDLVRARVILSTYKHAGDEEKAVYIRQGRAGAGVSISLSTLEAIVRWARG